MAKIKDRPVLGLAVLAAARQLVEGLSPLTLEQVRHQPPPPPPHTQHTHMISRQCIANCTRTHPPNRTMVQVGRAYTAEGAAPLALAHYSRSVRLFAELAHLPGHPDAEHAACGAGPRLPAPAQPPLESPAAARPPAASGAPRLICAPRCIGKNWGRRSDTSRNA